MNQNDPNTYIHIYTYIYQRSVMLQSSKRKLLWAGLLSIMVAKANSAMNSCSQPRHREIILLLSLEMAKRLSRRIFSMIGRWFRSGVCSHSAWCFKAFASHEPCTTCLTLLCSYNKRMNNLLPKLVCTQKSVYHDLQNHKIHDVLCS